MPATPGEVVRDLRLAMAVIDPNLDTSIGTVSRKIMDVVAEQISEAYQNAGPLDHAYDVHAREGADLDDFLALFGFARQPALRATGTVTFELGQPLEQAVVVPVNAEVEAPGTTVVVATVVPAVIPAGTTSVDVPVQAVNAGAAGNVGPGALTGLLTSVRGVNSVSNASAMTGGSDPESDQHLRHRFVSTWGRNFAGTDDMFLGVALEDPAVRRANVIGARHLWRERIEIVGGTATSTVPDAKYVWPETAFLAVDLDEGDLFNRNVHFELSNATPPVLTALDTVNVPDGVYDLRFHYVPTSSRNDPEAGINNRIDLYVDGVREESAVETTVFDQSRLFSDTSTDPLWVGNFERMDGTQPDSTSRYIPLAWTPLTTLPDSLTVDGKTYNEGVDYQIIRDISPSGGGLTGSGGIEWMSVQGDPEGVFVVGYTYNAVPSDVEGGLARWHLTTTDPRVHAAQMVPLDFGLVVMLSAGRSLAAVSPDIRAAIVNLLERHTFGDVIQVSDVLSAVTQVEGVDAARMRTSSDDGTRYAIQRISLDGSTIVETYDSAGQPVDVHLDAVEVASVNEVRITVRAQNTFGSV